MRHHHHTRRDFLSRTAVGPLVCTLARGWEDLLAAQRAAPEPAYDLLVKGGRVVDPSQGLSAERDVAIAGNKVVKVAENIAETEAGRVLDARGKIVTPGLIDVHVHVYDGVAPLGIPADPNCIAKGVTTVVDAGSSGAHTFPGLRKYVINVVDTRVFALLNISVVGQSTLSPDNPWGELIDIRYANPKLAIKTIEQNRDVILGLKIRMTENIAGRHDLDALKLAREAADAVRLPLMVHIGGSFSTLPKILDLMRPGDVITHTYRQGAGGILDDQNKVLPEVRRAVQDGVRLDVGHGAGSFGWAVAEAAMQQDLAPGTISSDVHQYNVHGPVYDLATTLSKFLHLGMKLEDVIACASLNPARTFGFPRGLGTLKEGSEGDVSVFSLIQGDFESTDSVRQSRVIHRRLMPVATIKAGRIYGSASIPVVTL